MKKVFLFAAALLLAAGLTAQTKWTEPAITPVDFAEAQHHHVTDSTSNEVYLSTLQGMETTVNNNIQSIQISIKEVKTALKNYGSTGKAISAELKAKTTQQKLLSSGLKTIKSQQKDLEKQKKSITKDKELSAEQKTAQIAAIDQHLQQLATDSQKSQEQLTKINKDIEEIKSRQTSNNALVSEANNRLKLLDVSMTKEKSQLAAIKSEIKMVKTLLKTAK